MKHDPSHRAVVLGEYIIENRTTVRAAAKQFGISKSTVHKDVSERLKKEDPALYRQVKDILEINKQERHIRGGLATKRKYANLAENKKHSV
ncbi:MAG: sporulation transcriptional regulator SpoIIID [Ruminococcus sp.]|nr:sporulation transcriptional regulator SpoIIID [Ruminococcus sp.]